MYLRRYKYYSEIITYPKKIGEKEERIEFIEDPIKIMKSLLKISDKIMELSSSTIYNREKFILNEIKQSLQNENTNEKKIVEVEKSYEEEPIIVSNKLPTKTTTRKSTSAPKKPLVKKPVVKSAEPEKKVVRKSTKKATNS